MKKGVKIALIIAGCLFAAGVVICGATLALRGLDAAVLPFGKENSKTETVSLGVVESITIKGVSGNVFVQCGEDSETYAECKDWNIEVKDGKAVIERIQRSFGVNILTGWFVDSLGDIRLTLPKDFAGELFVENSSGSISIVEVSAKRLELSTSSGSITLESTACESLSADTSSGKISGNGLAANDAVLATSSGRVELNHFAGRVLNAESSSGGLYVQADCQSINLNAGSGDITGIFTGARADYTIESDTGSGENDLGRGGSGDRRLSVKTGSGDIKCSFEDE